MTINITPISPPARLAGSAPVAGAGTQRAGSTAAAAAQEAVHVDTIPSSPPPEVQDAIGVAARSYEKLQAGGHELRFEIDPQTQKVVIGIHDLQGNLLWTAPPSKAIELAAGGELG